MEFFVPFASSPEEAERVFASLAEYYQAADKRERIYKLVFRHDGQTITAEVGQPMDRRYDGGIVLVILYGPSRDLWYVITTNRGIDNRTMPILAGRDIVSAEPFAKPNPPGSGPIHHTGA